MCASFSLRRKHRRPATQKAADYRTGWNALSIRPEWLFVALALPAGLFLALRTGPFQAPDEINHFLRAFQLSEGTVMPERVHSDGSTDLVGGTLPLSLFNACEPFAAIRFNPSVKVDTTVTGTLLNTPFSYEPRVFMGFNNTATYSPVPYVPQVIGIWVGRITGFSALRMMYAGRLVNLLCWVMLIALAIRITPVFKWVLVLVGLMPMAIFLAASLSADVMINGLAILFAAMVLRHALAQEAAVTLTGKVWFVVLCVLLATLRQGVYIPLVFMLLFIPSGNLGGWNRKVVFLSVVLVSAIAAAATWAYLIRGFHITIERTDPAGQLAFITAHPWEYAKVLLRTLKEDGSIYLREVVGVLGWLDTELPRWIYLSYLPLLASAALLDAGEGRPMKRMEKALIAAICLVVVLTIVTAEYITWTAMGGTLIAGLQGRYVIPLVVPMLLLLYNRRLAIPARWMTVPVAAYCTVVLVVTCMTVVHRYYG
jgi:uncharacterized membrane protein